MVLSEFQKTIVKEIVSGNIFDIYSFVNNIKIPVKIWGGIKLKKSFSIAVDYRAAEGTIVNKVMDDEAASYQFKEFIAMWEFLENIKMVKSITFDQ